MSSGDHSDSFILKTRLFKSILWFHSTWTFNNFSSSRPHVFELPNLISSSLGAVGNTICGFRAALSGCSRVAIVSFSGGGDNKNRTYRTSLALIHQHKHSKGKYPFGNAFFSGSGEIVGEGRGLGKACMAERMQVAVGRLFCEITIGLVML